VHAAIDAVLEAGLSPLKINCVLMRDTPGLPGNEHELLDFARLSMDRPIDVRFIEYMPFDGNAWALKRLVPFKEAIGRLREAYPGLQPIVTDKHDVATSWKLPGAQGQVSFVSSMTAPFCGGCNRLRLTADGNIKTCLFGNDELSLRDALREGATEPELLRLVWAALQGKHARHAGERFRVRARVRVRVRVRVRDRVWEWG